MSTQEKRRKDKRHKGRRQVKRTDRQKIVRKKWWGKKKKNFFLINFKRINLFLLFLPSEIHYTLPFEISKTHFRIFFIAGIKTVFPSGNFNQYFFSYHVNKSFEIRVISNWTTILANQEIKRQQNKNEKCVTKVRNH